MNGKERLSNVLAHRNADTIAVDFGSTAVTGIHCRIVEGLRNYYGLDAHPVYVHEPFQMLGLIEEDLAEAIGTDCVGAFGQSNMFGVKMDGWKEVKMHWGQTVRIPESMTMVEEEGRIYTHPEGETSVPACAVLPESGFFFDAIERNTEEMDDEKLNVEENLEEFTLLSEQDIAY